MALKQNVGTIHIPEVFRSYELHYTSDYVEYRGTRIRWNDLTGFFCKNTGISWDGLPPTIDVDWVLESADDNIFIMYGGGPFSSKKKRDIYQQLVAVAQQFALPSLIKRYMRDIAQTEAPVEVGGIGFSSNGIHFTMERIFRSPLKYFLPWSEILGLSEDADFFNFYDLDALNDEGGTQDRPYDSRRMVFSVPKSDYNWMIIPEITSRCAKALSNRPFIFINDRKISLK